MIEAEFFTIWKILRNVYTLYTIGVSLGSFDVPVGYIPSTIRCSLYGLFVRVFYFDQRPMVEGRGHVFVQTIVSGFQPPLFLSLSRHQWAPIG